MSKALFKDTAFYGASDFIIKVLSFFLFPILANLLSVRDFGIITLAGTFAGFIGMFMSLGINNAVQRFYFDPESTALDQQKIISSGLWVLISWSIIIAVLFLLLAYPFDNFLNKRYEMPWKYFALSLLALVPNLIITYCNDVIRLHFKPVYFFTISLIKNLAALIGGIVVLYYFNAGITGYLWVTFLAPLIMVPLAVYFIRKDLKFRIDKAWTKEIVKIGYPFVFMGIAYWLFGSMDRWLLSEFSDNTQVGLYSIAFKIGTVIMFVNSAFGQAWSPIAIKMMTDNPTTYKKKFTEIFSIFTWILILVGSAVCLFTKEFFVYTMPTTYWAAANATIFILVGMVVHGTTQLTALGISISKKTYIFSRVAWFTAIINLVLNIALIPKWGATGSAVATAITYLVLSLSYYYYTQKLHPIPFDVRTISLAFLIFIIVVGISLYLNLFTELKYTIIKVLILVILTAVIGYVNRTRFKQFYTSIFNK